MERRSGKRSISGLAALILLGVFASGILAVLLTGARTYKALTDRDALSYDGRTCVQYLTNKVRQAPAPDSVVLSSFGSEDCLLIVETIAGPESRTQIYLWNGWLMELFSAADAGLAPEDGEKLFPAKAFSTARTGSLLHMELTDGNGREHSVLLSLRGGEEGAP